MTIDVVMPKWGDTMQEGVIVEWSVAVGDTVAEGDALAAVETEKVEADIESPAAGVVVGLLVEEGESADVGAVVARLETA
jgi:pyruvate/2-oxoglutarate dehydrogenase complex dihydrolipoamide acyltransferase (E2) component